MQGLREWRTMYHQNPTLLCNTSKAITRATMSHPCRIAAKTLGTAFLPLDFLLLPTLRPLSHSQRKNQPRRKRRNAEEALAFDASYKPNNIRNMKEELLEAIYGTVERLEQKVDELSASTKNAGAETVPASNDITKLDKSINAMFIKEEEVRGKISKLRDAIVVFADLIKVELGKNEQRNKFLVDAVKQMIQGNDVSSKALQDKLEVMNNSPQKKVVTHRFEPTSKYILLFIGGLLLSLVISIWGNLTQWREHQDWEEADLKYRALKMVLPSDDPNIRYIEKHFNVQRDEDVIYKLRTRVDVYEDSVYQHHKMVEVASYKDSIARQLIDESNRIKMQINSKKSK